MDVKNQYSAKAKFVSSFYKIVYMGISTFFIALNFPLLDWFLHSEKLWYNNYELNYETSFLYAIYDKMGILDETLGHLYSLTYGSKWLHECYHLYNIKSCFDSHPVYAISIFYLLTLFMIAIKDIKNQKGGKFKTIIYYAIPFIIIVTISAYGFLVFAPQYYNTIDDIISCF